MNLEVVDVKHKVKENRMKNLPFAHCLLSYHNYDREKKCVACQAKSVSDCKKISTRSHVDLGL